MSVSDQAVVLRLSDFSESSQVATVLARCNGKLRLLYKGARRSTKARFTPGLDLLERGEIGFIGARGDSQLGTLTDWRQMTAFLGLRRDLARLHAGLYCADAVNVLTADHDPHPEVFDALCETLAALDGERAAPPVTATFQWRLLESLGFEPNLRACVECGRERGAGRSAYFNLRAGGLLCRACAERRPGLQLLRADLLDAPRSGPAAGAWFAFLDRLLTYIAERKLELSDTLLRDFPRAARSDVVDKRGDN